MLLPLSGYVENTEAESNIVYAGVTDGFQGITYSEAFLDNSILTVSINGEISQQTLAQGKLTPLWTYQLNVTTTNARLDTAQQLLAVSYDSGLLVFSISTKEIFYQHNISNTPDDIDWDSEGNVWIAYYTGIRKAVEYEESGSTGIQTGTVSPGFLAFEVLDNDLISFSAMDSNTHIYDQTGAFVKKLTQSNNYLTTSYQDDEGSLIVGSSIGSIYRYNTSTWAATSLNLGVSERVSSISQFNSTIYYVGTEEGSIFIVGSSPFVVQESFSIGTNIIAVFREFGGQLSILTYLSQYSEIIYFDVDSDMDGTPDTNDRFPTEPSQSSDTDNDGYGDNLSGINGDAFPNDPTQHSDIDGDGYGDNQFGTLSDAFISNPYQWKDSDGDGYGDNKDALGGDMFPNEPSQWNDSDGDNYGDNPNGVTPDGCPNTNGFSTLDRYGCLDSDFDYYSDPSESWTFSEHKADAIPNDITQWEDQDGDGYGDNAEPATEPDSCRLIAGSSTKTWQADQSSPTGYSETTWFGCLDSDGDGWADSSDPFPNDRFEWFDGDGDKIGSNSDFDDTKILVSTEQDYCMQAIDNLSNICLGWRDYDYQEYLYRDKSESDRDLSYSSWIINLDSGLLDEEEDELSGTIKQVTITGIVVFVILTALILMISFIVKKRRLKVMVKRYGVPFEPEEVTATEEALEGSAGLSASGGIDSDASWEEDVEEMDFTIEESTEENLDDSQENSVEGIYDEENTLEDIAGIEMDANETSSEEVAAMFDGEEEDESEKPNNAPPVPASGLPEGWTMDQWEWYGKEWLAKNGES